MDPSPPEHGISFTSPRVNSNGPPAGSVIVIFWVICCAVPHVLFASSTINV